MPRTEEKQQPVLELRLGGVHVVVQRISPWLVAAVVTTVVTTMGSGLTAWFTSR
ncbi:hypothetical protein [Streptomyces sp. PAM3C]|uniref:hypothetical protein n=1 Tax=Streptomyces sp. PAM3C TaxID=2847300 RepID=UPI001C1E0696|nr:hypothetical protein [Streptomyces sp. PAM3C]